MVRDFYVSTRSSGLYVSHCVLDVSKVRSPLLLLFVPYCLPPPYGHPLPSSLVLIDKDGPPERPRYYPLLIP